MLRSRILSRFPGLQLRSNRNRSTKSIRIATACASLAALVGASLTGYNSVALRCSDSIKDSKSPSTNQAEDLMEAVRANDRSQVARILASGINVRIRDSEGWTAAHWATEMGHKELVLFLLDKDPILLNTKTNEGLSPINIAAWRGDKAMVELLLAQGAEIDDKTKWGEIPLHHAVTFEHLDVCEFLLKSGSNMFAEDKLSRTPYMIVMQKGSAKMKQLFERYKPKPSE